MKRFGSLTFLLMFLIVSCGSAPETPEPAPSAGTVQPAPVQVFQVEPVEPPQAGMPPAETVRDVPPEPAAGSPEEPVFDPDSVSEDRFITTMTDVQTLIGELNRIIKAKDYNTWKTFLSESYFSVISAPEFLEERTEELYRRDQTVASSLGRDTRKIQKKILKNVRDYFDNVVVPSRQNDRVDDIAFVSENRVIAYTRNSRGNRLILYDLEIIDGKWKIIN